MAKKKKTQLKPVARGFATTSVPKKLTPAPVDEPTLAAEDAEPGDKVDGDAHGIPAGSTNVATSQEPDLAQVEQQELQALVEKLQDKTEKEIVRTIKALETERRFSKTLPVLELDPQVANSIIEYAVESSNSQAEIQAALEDYSEDQALHRVGITYGALRRLGYSEARVLECLNAIRGVELDEAFEWLCLHCSLDELENDGLTPEAKPSTKSGSTQTPQTPRTPSQFQITPSSTGLTTPPTPARLDANAPEFRPSGLLFNQAKPSPQNMPTGDLTQDNSSTKQSSGTDSGRSSPGTLDPTGQYVQLKLQFDAIQYKKDARNRDKAERLQRKLTELKSDYMFSQKEANALYQIERKKVDAATLKKKLEGKEDLSSPAPAAPINLKSESGRSLAPLPAPDGESDDEQEGGMFSILESLPETETTKEGTTITIREMALPKHWSGRTPKALLKEMVAKQDRYAAISYRMISGHSRAKRASVTIRWEGRSIGEWTMEDIACHDETQAEQYISTVALHAITFPLTEGFTAIPLSNTGQTFFRTFPAVFRDLWDELEIKRKERDDEINREAWKKLRTIVHEKYDSNEKVQTKSSRQVQDGIQRSSGQNSMTRNLEISEQVASLYEQCHSSTAYDEMLAHRNLLPIAGYRKEILSTLEESQILVLSGETGCGKSTQVPSFILEDQLSRGKHCKIYCTEPRRISAISLAQRVSQELGESPNALGTVNSLVGYSIRLESNTSRNTCLTFVTNGIALRMLEGGSGPAGQGTAFDEITHIIIDEVHERTIESDFLLIVLKSLLRQRPDLRVILMSATLDAEKISTYFDGCPTFHVPGRTFPVNVNYLEDAVELTKWTINETSPFARRLHDKYYQTKGRDWSEDAVLPDDDGDEATQKDVKLEKRYSAETTTTINLLDERLIPFDLIVRLLETICCDSRYADYSPAILVFMPGIGEIRRLNDALMEHQTFGSEGKFRIYPLHSTLSSENQSAVFDIPPQGIRKIVIATNIAETGITIPDVTCVIDTGKHREMRFDEKRQISRLVETFIARSNAAQRRGRAGRVREGICFHLFTKLRCDTQMAESPLPEMMRLSLADLALRIKIMKVNFGSSIENVLSQALDPPTSINIQRAVAMLVEVRALTPSEDITPMGRLLSKLPTDVHLGKFLLIATILRCLDPALTIAAALNSKSPFVTPFGQEQEADRAKQAFRVENSDFLTIHHAFSSWRQASTNPSFVRKFCRTNYLSHQNLQQIEDLRQQFLGYLVDSNFIRVDKGFVRELSRARYGRNRNRFVHVPQELNVNANNTFLVNAALAAGLFPKVLSVDSANSQMRTLSNNQVAFIHPSSANFGRRIADFGVNYLSYFTLMHSKKLYAWEIGPVDDIALVLLCGECDFKLAAGSAIIDRKLKFRISPKSNIALKILRGRLAELLSDQFRGKPLKESQIWWNAGAIKVLGKLEWEPKEQPSIILS